MGGCLRIKKRQDSEALPTARYAFRTGATHRRSGRSTRPERLIGFGNQSGALVEWSRKAIERA